MLLFDFLTPIWKIENAGPDDARRLLVNLAVGYREEYTLEAVQLELLPDLLALREALISNAFRAELEKWDLACPGRGGTVADLMSWIERRWINGRPEYPIDFGGI